VLLSELLQQFSLATAAPLTDDFVIRGVRPLGLAKAGDLSFLNNPKYRAQVATTDASAVLVKEALPDCAAIQILCNDPYVSLAMVLAALYPEASAESGIHPSAVVDPSAVVNPTAAIGPLCVICAGASVGAGVELVSSVNIGPGAQVGDGSKLFPGVVLYAGVTVGRGVRIHANTVIGSDGFGYAQHQGRCSRLRRALRLRQRLRLRKSRKGDQWPLWD